MFNGTVTVAVAVAVARTRQMMSCGKEEQGKAKADRRTDRGFYIRVRREWETPRLIGKDISGSQFEQRVINVVSHSIHRKRRHPHAIPCYVMPVHDVRDCCLVDTYALCF